MTSVAALTDGEDHVEFFRPNKIQRTSREDGTPGPFPGPWKIQKKGMNFLNLDHFKIRKESVKSADSDKQWEENYAKLVEYKEMWGDSNVPVYFKDRELVAWVEEQRKAFHNGSLPPAVFVRLHELDFVFHATDDKNKEDYVTRPEESNILNDQNQETTKSVSDAPDPAMIRRYERYGISSPSIKNPYAKPPPRSTCQDAVSRESDFASRFQSTSNSQAGASDNSSRRPPVAAAAPTSSLTESSSSPKTILERLQPHPPTPEMVEHHAKNATDEAAASLRDEGTTDEQAALNIRDDKDHISTDGDDKEESFVEEISSGRMFSHAMDNLRQIGFTFMLGIRNIGSAAVFRMMLLIYALRRSIGAVKHIAYMQHAHDEEDKNPLTKDKDDDGQVAAEEEGAPIEQETVAKSSYFANILRQGGMVLWFCLRKGSWLLLSCLTFILYALGFSAGVGIVMGYLILLGKIDVPAINDALGVRIVQ